MSWLNLYLNFASKNIYGLIPILAVVYVIFFLLRKFFKKLPHPGIFVLPSFFICLLIFPPIPKYIFENKVLSEYKNAGELKLVKSIKWGSFIEPITLIKTPISFFHFVSPTSLSRITLSLTPPSSWKDFKEKDVKEYRSIIHRFDEPTKVQLVHADCSDSTISISEPIEGVLRYVSLNENMSKTEKRIYCETDYSHQVKMYQCKYRILSELSNVSEKNIADANQQCKSE